MHTNTVYFLSYSLRQAGRPVVSTDIHLVLLGLKPCPTFTFCGREDEQSCAVATFIGIFAFLLGLHFVSLRLSTCSSLCSFKTKNRLFRPRPV